MGAVEHAALSGVGATVEAVLEFTGYMAELAADNSIEAQGRIEKPAGAGGGGAREFDEALDTGDVSGVAVDRRSRRGGRTRSGEREHP